MGQAKTSCLIGNAYIPPGIEPSLRRNISTIGSDRCAFGTAWDPAHAGLPTMAGNTTRTERNKNREPNYNKPYLGTVAILAQGTHRGDALCAALFLRCLFEYLSITYITVLHPHAVIYYLHRGSAPSRCHILPTSRFCTLTLSYTTYIAVLHPHAVIYHLHRDFACRSEVLLQITTRF